VGVARKRLFRSLPRIPKVSWRDLVAIVGPVLLTTVGVALLAYHFIEPAPPSTLRITSGPEGSAFRRNAEKYQKILARSGVKLEILPSGGSIHNLARLVSSKPEADIGFVQGGVLGTEDISRVMSLGSVFYEPLQVFYRSKTSLARLSGLKGQRIAIGPPGSGTRHLALALLKANGIEPGGTAELVEIGGAEAREALVAKQVDAVFLMSDSSAPADARELRKAEGIRAFDFTAQADAYLRRFRYLSKLELPAGAFDLGANIPTEPLTLLAPTVELVARSNLHPALSDLLIEAAREVHGRASLFQKAGEFPSLVEREFPVSEDAERYFKSGKRFLYRNLPFWLASLIDRIWVLLVPILVVLVPGLKVVPTLYSWRIRNRIYKRYGELMALERASLQHMTAEQKEEFDSRLDAIERAVIAMKIPSAFADQVYVLRLHIKFVRDRKVDPSAYIGTP
jgi:TRAP transporter TAXI family solute receptor